MLHSCILSLLFISYGVSFAQLAYKPVVLSNGFENGKLVRNHVEIHYTHKTDGVISGYIIADRLLELASNTETLIYTTHVKKDTIATFYGTVHKGKKTGTFVSRPQGNIIYIDTYEKDIQQGPFKGFFTNGNLYNEGYHVNGQRVGDYKQYYANGSPAIYINKGDIKGLAYVEYFYHNGQLESKGALYNDKKVNEWIYYTYQGSLEKKEYYTNKGKLLKRL